MKFRTLAALTATITTVLVGWFVMSRSTPAAQHDLDRQPARIAWYATLQSGLAEAKRSNRPILFTSAAPQCLGVPGIW